MPSSAGAATVSDYEPDEAWKENKKQEIANGFQTMIQDAKDRLESKLQALPYPRDSPEWKAQREIFFAEYHAEQELIKALARDEFTHSLGQERLVRRMATGGSVNATVEKSVLEEQ
ncbi:hypothetical protein B0H19DRAFT_936475, partial [Mycena capillaripes]